MDLPEAPSPAAVELDRAAGLTVRWEDGTELRFALPELRRNCPCAECRGLREQGRTVGPRPGTEGQLRAEDAQLVGGWGMSIRWNDGHDTGIYAWSVLRAWGAADREERADAGEEDEPSGGGEP